MVFQILPLIMYIVFRPVRRKFGSVENIANSARLCVDILSPGEVGVTTSSGLVEITTEMEKQTQLQSREQKCELEVQQSMESRRLSKCYILYNLYLVPLANNKSTVVCIFHWTVAFSFRINCLSSLGINFCLNICLFMTND